MNLAVVTNILTPYRIPLFEAIRKRVEALHVFLMAEREENRDWTLSATSFQCDVLPGFHVKPPGAEVSLHVNHGVMRALRRANPDVVLSGGYAPANIEAWLYCRMHQRPFVSWGELSTQDIAGITMLRRGLRRVMTSWSEGAIASSSDARNVFAYYGLPQDRILTSLMPIDVKFFHEEATAWRASDWWQSERCRFSGPILLSVGRLTERKGYRELFEMYAAILRQRPNVSLIIVGEGPDRVDYESLVRRQQWPHVRFLGFRQADEVVKFLALADVFVFPTLFDPFGAVLSEAMAAGLPVVSSVHAAATNDLVVDGITGFRIEPKDIDQSSEVILRVLDMTPTERATLGRAAYERVSCHDIDTTADNMVSFLRTIRYVRMKPTADHIPIESAKGSSSLDG
jgi:glycosyltransferase involved in cell wall biosynthesis